MKGILILTALIIGSISETYAQSVWFKQYAGQWNEYQTDAAIDSENNVYITGNFTANAMLSDGQTSANAGFFVAKYSPSGALIWMTKGKGKTNTTVSPNGLDCSNGHLVLAVNFNDSLYLGDFEIASNESAFGHGEVAVMKLNTTDGTVSDHKLFSGSSDASIGVSDIRVNASGDIFVTGGFEVNADFGNGHQLSCWSGLYNELYVVKLNASLEAQWTYKPSSERDTRGTNLELDNNGDVIVSGVFFKGCDFGAGNILAEGTQNNPIDRKNIFLMKLSKSDGTLGWMKALKGDLEANAPLACDDSGNIFLGVNYINYMISESDNTSATGLNMQLCIMKYNATGNRQWIKHIGWTSPDAVQALAVNQSGELIMGGTLGGNVTIDGVTDSYSSFGNITMVLGHLNNSTGTLIGIQKLNDSGSNFAGITNIAISSVDDRFLTSGYFVGTINLGSIGSLVNSAPGYNDSFAIMNNGEPLGMDEMELVTLNFYPNPATDLITIDLEYP